MPMLRHDSEERDEVQARRRDADVRAEDICGVTAASSGSDHGDEEGGGSDGAIYAAMRGHQLFSFLRRQLGRELRPVRHRSVGRGLIRAAQAGSGRMSFVTQNPRKLGTAGIYPIIVRYCCRKGAGAPHDVDIWPLYLHIFTRCI